MWINYIRANTDLAYVVIYFIHNSVIFTLL